MTGTLALLAIVAAIGTGYYLFKRLGSGPANGTYDALATASAAFWVLAGVFAILGGFVFWGMVMIIVFSYIGLSKGTATKQRLRSRIAG